jgi:N-acetyl-gamma-glutamyl-phosphate reductase
MRVAVIGASGFVGQELVGLVAKHPAFELVAAQANQRAGSSLGDLVPGLPTRLARMVLDPVDARRPDVELAFLALPHGRSAAIAAALLARGVRVVDLGADLRLGDELIWQRWYGEPHGAPELLGAVTVGVAEHVRDELPAARAWAVPGCYVTATVLGAHPLLDAGIAARQLVLVDAISGVTGAGSTPSDTTHFVSVAEGVRAYALGGHRHVPEMRALLGAPVRFTPHLGPYARGISATITLSASGELPGVAEVRRVLEEAYADAPFVSVAEVPPSTRSVRGSNRAVLSATVDADANVLVVVSVIDNLGKGAAGHAVQGANLMVGLPEDAGLAGGGLWP